jgi:hypothetical protein
MGILLSIETGRRVCHPNQPAPAEEAARWEHPDRVLTGVSNDKALAYFVCEICDYDFLGLNPE